METPQRNEGNENIVWVRDVGLPLLRSRLEAARTFLPVDYCRIVEIHEQIARATHIIECARRSNKI